MLCDILSKKKTFFHRNQGRMVRRDSVRNRGRKPIRNVSERRRKNENGGKSSDGFLHCKLCPYTTKHRCNIQRHRKRHTSPRFSCRECNMPFATVGHLMGHCRSAHGREDTNCGQEVNSRSK